MKVAMWKIRELERENQELRRGSATTSSEKRRDEQLGTLFDLNYQYSVLSEQLQRENDELREQLEQGCRMTRELTDDVIDRLWEEYTKPDFRLPDTPYEIPAYSFAEAIAAYVTGVGG